MTEDTQSDVLKLAAGLREMQRELDASREDAHVRDSERRRLTREVDILSHLLCSHEASPQGDAGPDAEQDGLNLEVLDADDESGPHRAS